MVRKNTRTHILPPLRCFQLRIVNEKYYLLG